MREDRRQVRRCNLIYSILSFTLVFTISFVVLFVIEKNFVSIKNTKLKENEEHIVGLENKLISKEFGDIISDLKYMYNVYGPELMEQGLLEHSKEHWREFSAQRKMYDQIRYIDSQGNEKIRINRENNESYIVSEDNLQNKKDRYYFYETERLDEGDIYISSLDLNIEGREIEEPYKPMLRLATPLYDKEGVFQGIIILNYLAEDLLKSFREIAEYSEGELMLLNSSGYWVSSEDSSRDWNFMFQDRRDESFSKEFPGVWEKVQKEPGQEMFTRGLFTYTPVKLKHRTIEAYEEYGGNIHLSDGDWYIVSSVMKGDGNEELFIDSKSDLALYVLEKNSAYFWMIAGVSVIIAFLAYLNRKTYTKIKYYSEYDGLTQLYNRRAGMSKLKALFPEDDKRKVSMSLCFVDINGLKQVNDILGHKSGDELIITVSDIIKSTIRENDFAIRLGGDEFLIVFSGIDSSLAETVWERIVKKYDDINETENRPYLISASHGIIYYDEKHRSPIEELIKVADEKMYSEKRAIKENLVVIRERYSLAQTKVIREKSKE